MQKSEWIYRNQTTSANLGNVSQPPPTALHSTQKFFLKSLELNSPRSHLVNFLPTTQYKKFDSRGILHYITPILPFGVSFFLWTQEIGIVPIHQKNETWLKKSEKTQLTFNLIPHKKLLVIVHTMCKTLCGDESIHSGSQWLSIHKEIQHVWRWRWRQIRYQLSNSTLWYTFRYVLIDLRTLNQQLPNTSRLSTLRPHLFSL